MATITTTRLERRERGVESREMAAMAAMAMATGATRRIAKTKKAVASEKTARKMASASPRTPKLQPKISTRSSKAIG